MTVVGRQISAAPHASKIALSGILPSATLTRCVSGITKIGKCMSGGQRRRATPSGNERGPLRVLQY